MKTTLAVAEVLILVALLACVARVEWQLWRGE